MNDYRPDKWLVVKINSKNPHYRVFANWYGGYLGSDSWKLNSGITKATLDGFVYSFEGSSGSVYECHKDLYGTSGYGAGVLSSMIDKADKEGYAIDVLPEDTNFLELNYDE